MLAASFAIVTVASLPKRWLDRHRTPKLREMCHELRIKPVDAWMKNTTK